MKDESVARDLRNRTREYALRIVRLYTNLPKSTEAQVIGKQVLRSGTSVGAHYREGSRARSTAEFVSKMAVGQQELDETLYWIEFLSAAEIVAPTRLEDLIDETNELLAIFATCIKNAKGKSK
ncbi:MAG: four helix bundle protein [Planctomycetaceae bacterium]